MQKPKQCPWTHDERTILLALRILLIGRSQEQVYVPRVKTSSKASILWHSAFFTVQLPQPYMTTGKTIALTRRTFVVKVMSLLFNMLSRLVMYGDRKSTRLNSSHQKI